MKDWLFMQSFYHGLTQKAHKQLDATTGELFMLLTLGKAETLMEKIPLIKAGHHVTFNHAIGVKKYQKRCVHCQPRWTYC
jgi:hypothetical protein